MRPPSDPAINNPDELQDIANHQIRHLRFGLIEDTIKFEQKHHCNRIAGRRIDPYCSRRWFDEQARSPRSHTECEHSDLGTGDPLRIFLNGFLSSLCCPVSIETLPETFSLDADRIMILKTEIHDNICLDLCEEVFVDLTSTLVANSTTSVCSRESLRLAITSIVDYGPYGSKWYENLDNIVVELARHASREDDQCPGIDNKDREHRLRQTAEQTFRTAFFDPNCSYFWSRGIQLKDKLLPLIRKNMENHLDTSPIDIFNAFVAPGGKMAKQRKQSLGHSASQPPLAEEFVLDIVRRISHIAVLHWRIWSPLVYLYEPKAAAAQMLVIATGANDNGTAIEGSAHGQRLSSDPVNMRSGSNDTDEKRITVDEVGIDRASVDEVTTIAGAHDTATMTDDPSSPVLYKQRTN